MKSTHGWGVSFITTEEFFYLLIFGTKYSEEHWKCVISWRLQWVYVGVLGDAL